MSITNRFITVVAAGAALALAVPSIVLGSSSVAANAATPSSAAAQVIVSGFSEKGDYIDNGVSSVYFSHWVKVTATTSGIYLSNKTPQSFATYSFAPIAGQTFTVGTYDNVQPAAYRSAGFPGIEITGPGRPGGCTRLTGSFRIWDLAADASGNITRLDLTYVEHCGAGRASNYGEVMINDAPHLGQLVASATRIAFPDQTPTLPYVLSNPTSQAQPVSLWQSATTVSHFTVTPLRPSCASTVPANSSCTYLLRLL
ncbi:MAG TPA: hypothetical protein VII84_03395, partial [Acidimicrobiales bacterium]